MVDNKNEKKTKIKNINNRRREKFIKPLITDEDNESDVYFSVVKNRKKKEEIKTEIEKNSDFYLSPMRGKVENRSTFPITNSRGKIGKQYDFVRQEKKIKQEELKNQYGHEYYEFNIINNNTSRDKIKNNMVDKTPDLNINSQKVNLVENEFSEEKVQITENRKVNIIYEEEIDIDENKSIYTSYDENNKATFFNDFEKTTKVDKDDKHYASIDVYEHQDDSKGLKAELKKLFAEDDYSQNEEIYYQDNFSYDVPSEKENFENNKKQESEKKVNFINIKEEINQELKTKVKVDPKYRDLDHYTFPPIDLLNESSQFVLDDTEWIESQMMLLDSTLDSFGIFAKTVNYTQGPAVTRYEIEPEPGTKVSKITALQDDIKLRLAASDIRIEAPISGKSTVGVEVPNKEVRRVRLREILESPSYKSFKSPLKIALGLDITGDPIFSDISNMTHSLIAGSTGSGKSVCINTIIISILYNALPDEVKLVLIDPKKVEFSLYRDLPHLLTPVINDPKIATSTLRWLTQEMDRRYELIESVGARDIKSYNIKRNRSAGDLAKLPYIVVIIDELADLMVIAAAEVEEYIQRISQLARAAGIHLIVATQRPSTNVITGTIKTNIPTRIAFKVASAIDSRIILDEVGAEKLLGKGDMLLSDNDKPQLKRLQGSFISDEEIETVTNYIKNQLSPHYSFTSEDLVKKESEFVIDYDDELFDDVVRFVIELGEASASRIQRQYKVGYNRAARIIDMMEKYNIIGPQQNGSKPREVLMNIEEYEHMVYT